MKNEGQAEVASLTQTRDRLVKLRTALKNKINNLLSARGIELDKESLSSKKGLTGVLEQKLELLARFELDIIVADPQFESQHCSLRAGDRGSRPWNSKVTAI